jgi:hypothetical protein
MIINNLIYIPCILTRKPPKIIWFKIVHANLLIFNPKKYMLTPTVLLETTFYGNEARMRQILIFIGKYMLIGKTP